MAFFAPLIFLILAMVVLFGSIKIVPQGYEFTVERFGRYTRTLKPGITILTPFVERVGRRVNMMEQVLDVPRQEVITKDNVGVQVDGIVFIQVIDAAASAYRVSNLMQAISQLAMTNLRTVVGSMELDEVLSQRDTINSRLLVTIDAATEPWGVKVARIEIKDLLPPPDISNAMTRQMKAERERRAVITEADGEKQAQITRAEGSKQGAILEAEGRREAAFRDAEARERAAQAEATATKSVSDAIEAGSVEALNYFIAQRYVEAFGKLATSPNQKTLIVPTELSGLTGALAGAMELLNSGRGAAAGGSAPAPRPPPSRGASFLVPRRRRLEAMSASLFADPLWIWLAVAAAVLAVEVATGSGYLLWASGSAGVVAVLHGLGLRLGWGGEVVVFAVLAIASTLAARRLRPRRAPAPGDDINDADARLVGREGRTVAAFHDAHGRVFVDGKEWAADADSAAGLPAGARVQVLTIIGGSRLRVRALG